jgi:NAD(P)-dependent dehydrogenase (short-subunit alcohol dehydrogenase family)
MQAPKSVVITGASSGIGRGCALRMDALGWRVFAGVRQERDAESLRAEASARLTPISLDVADPRSIVQARRVVTEALGDNGLDALVNNAAVPYGGPIEYLDMQEFRRTFDVNFFGLVEVIQAFLPLLRQAGGRIVNMSSISGWIASPFLSPYTTSKFALEALSDALRVEVHPWNIQVALIEPGAINTPIWNKGAEILARWIERSPGEMMRLYSQAIEGIRSRIKPHGIQPEFVIEAVVQALTSKRPKTRYAVGPDAILARVLRYLPDRWRDQYFLSQLRKA